MADNDDNGSKSTQAKRGATHFIHVAVSIYQIYIILQRIFC